ncbi:MAG: hypothetical protein MJY83_04970 [Bacteroidales bacterium]|nr:hypothetical protein [Bacteroidales bacterium]
MAKFDIISADGQSVRYSGTPKYHGSYMNVSYLEFGQICSPEPIDWDVEDYVLYSRTGLNYKLYFIPQAKKQSRRGTYGAAFVYAGVQLYAETKDLELAPFRDLVEGDNRIHFTTQSAISTYEDVDGIMRRIQASLDDIYPGKWRLEIMNISDPAKLEEMRTPLEFSVSGVSCLEALNKIYELWGIGWSHSTGYRGGVKYDIITLGIGAERHAADTTNEFRYGYGQSLRSIRRSMANKDDFATRLYVYGGMRNMLPDYYRNKGIYHADSVVIDNLMIPIKRWGKTSRLPDPAKAYVENKDAVGRYGLIPKVIYLDGEGDGEAIYPTIRNVTIGDIRRIILNSEDYSQYYYPSSIYSNSERADEVKSASPVGDKGYSGKDDGSKFLHSVTISYAGVRQENYQYTVKRNEDYYPLVRKTGSIAYDYFPIFEHLDLSSQASEGKMLTISSGITGSLRDNDGILDGLRCTLQLINHQNTSRKAEKIISWEVAKSGNSMSIVFPEMVLEDTNAFDDVSMYVYFSLRPTIPFPYPVVDGSVHYAELTLSRFDMVAGTSYNRSRFAKIVIKQIGFDLKQRQSLTGEGLATIAMIDGKCAGRSFYISDCRYREDTDDWELTLHRGVDESIGSWFPNDDYPIAAGDHFVLLDISMPELYVALAEERLYEKALALLGDMSKIKPFYEPEIDAKRLFENIQEHPGDDSYILREGKYMMLSDEDIIGEEPDYVIIDTLTINEDESSIPTYQVTLREEKKQSFSRSIENAIEYALSKVSSGPTSKVSVPTVADDIAGGRDGRDGADGKDGAPGKSAYQIAMEYYVGPEISEEEWIKSIQMPQGGMPGQVLKKRTLADWDVYWGEDLVGGGGGGGTDVQWGDDYEDARVALIVDGDERELATPRYVDGVMLQINEKIDTELDFVLASILDKLKQI